MLESGSGSPVVSVAERLRHLAVAQEIEGSNPFAHPTGALHSTQSPTRGPVKFAQSITIAAPAEQVWQIVRDIPTAASCIPGAREIRPTGDGGYQGSIHVRVGPISIELEGTVALKEEDAAARHMTMEVNGSARRLGGGVRGSMALQLEAPSQDQTELQVTADLTFLGRLGEMGQPLVKRKAEALLQEFARNLGQRAGA